MGIGDDGSEVDLSVVKEANARAQYADWCTKYKVEPDEDRFNVFWGNVERLEAYKDETGKTVQLNEVRDPDTDVLTPIAPFYS